MNPPSAPETVRPPVALGCFFAVSVVVVIFGIAAFAIVFLESGANTGEIRLDEVDAYGPGTAEFVGEHNMYVVRLLDGSFVALSDLDAANRASQGSRCRVALASLDDPALSASAQALRARMSPEAAGSTAVLRETCFGGLYDIAGTTLAPGGRNLDRFTVDVSSGVVKVDRSERTCSERTATTLFAPARC